MKRSLTIAALALSPLVLTACELGPKDTAQTGYRGTGMAETTLTSAALREEAPAPPYELPEDTGGPRAGEVYENVQVLGNVSVDEFNYIMAAITEWVAPDEGCNYCHNPANMASDEIYTKAVSRQMIAMTRALNGEYSNHTGQTGVTCYTCHRGNNVPEYTWASGATGRDSIIGAHPSGQNQPNALVGYASLPTDFYSSYLAGDARAARIQNEGMHPSGSTDGIKDAEYTYAMMMHLSSSLGVNCTYCHNTRAFGDWNASSDKRAVAWYGIQMVRGVNDQYVEPLSPLFPAEKLGPQGDALKVNCSTCHQGAAKPIGGAQMAKDYPGLINGAASTINLENALSGPMPTDASADESDDAAEGEANES